MRKLFLLASLLIAPVVSAQELHTFSNGEVADAEKINENFERLKESMGSQANCSARQDGSEVVINCQDGSFGIIGPGGGLINIEPYQGENPVFLDCNDVGDFVETAIDLRVKGENFLGYISASDFPSMNPDAEQTLKDILISVFSFEVFTASYSNKYLARWATEQAIDKVRRDTVESCGNEGWFERLEGSELAYVQDLSDNNSEKLALNVKGSGLVTSFPSGINCRSNCEVNFPAETEVILRAQPDAGYLLRSWSGDCASEKTSCQVVMSQGIGITVEFEEMPWTALGTFNIASLGANESSSIFEFVLPDTATSLEVYMTGGTDGDADLYVTSQNYYDINGSWQCVPQINGSDESCLTPQLRPLYPGARYLIGVYGYTAVSDISLSARAR